MRIGLIFLLFSLLANSVFALPVRYTGLNDYVLIAPNQGETNTCLFMASTGAMEILLNKSLGITNPEVDGPTDLSERYTISEDSSSRNRTWFENAFLKFDSGEAILQRDLPYTGFTITGEINYAVWNYPANFVKLPRIKLPAIDTEFLFSYGQYSRNVLTDNQLTEIKEALLKYESPIIAMTNDSDYWHAQVIVGFDDELVGDCYELDPAACRGKKGAFYVRDSFGVRLELRSYEWYKVRGNAAAVLKLR